MYNMR